MASTEAAQSVLDSPPCVYELLYHAEIPGRGEYVRLAFEAARERYKDVSIQDEEAMNKYSYRRGIFDTTLADDESGNPPAFAPPCLVHYGNGYQGHSLVISQTPNILLYLGSRLRLDGVNELDRYRVHELALTALDLCNEIHDTHHPIASTKYYEDQKEAALEYSIHFREMRIPKYLSHFERALKSNRKKGNCQYFVGSQLTYADTTIWQVLDGLLFAFPKELVARREEAPYLFNMFYDSLKEEKWLHDYLESDRRRKYTMGIFRHYPELDREEDAEDSHRSGGDAKRVKHSA